MEINYFIGVSSVLMMVVFIAPFIYLKKKYKAETKYFLWGMAAWTISIIIKLLMDVSISSTIVPLGVVVTALYVGIRTGVIESGISYLTGKKKLTVLSFKNAVTFGVGFGGLEAFLLGLISLTFFLLVAFWPESFSSLPEDVLNQLKESYSGSSLIALAAVIERISVLVIHIAATLLIFKSLLKKDIKYLVFSILYKSIVDGILPLLSNKFSLSSVQGVYAIEAVVLAVALIGVYIIIKTKNTLDVAGGKDDNKKFLDKR